MAVLAARDASGSPTRSGGLLRARTSTWPGMSAWAVSGTVAAATTGAGAPSGDRSAAHADAPPASSHESNSRNGDRNVWGTAMSRPRRPVGNDRAAPARKMVCMANSPSAVPSERMRRVKGGEPSAPEGAGASARWPSHARPAGGAKRCGTAGRVRRRFPRQAAGHCCPSGCSPGIASSTADPGSRRHGSHSGSCAG